jgi:methionyl-tRNA formyltransferase
MQIDLLSDNPDAWIDPYLEVIRNRLEQQGHNVEQIDDYRDLRDGELAFFLSCTTVVPPEYLDKHEHNLVVHESDVPRGRGWSPVHWQILEGNDTIPIVLMEAAEQVDTGDVYIRDEIQLEGTELLPDLREQVGNKTVDLVLQFVDDYPDVEGEPQQGEPSTYPRRTPDDSELDPDRTIAEQFNKLRIVDNDQYPAFFRMHGEKYILKIYREEPDG